MMNSPIKPAVRAGTVGPSKNLAHEQVKPSLFEEVSFHSIWASLTRPSFGMVLFLIGFNGTYFLPFIFPKTLYGDAQTGTYRFLIFSWVLIFLGGIWETFQGNLHLGRRKPVWMALSVVGLVLMVLRGLLDGELWLFVLQKSMPFFWLLVLPSIGTRKENWSWLWVTFLIHIAVGVPYALHTLFIEEVNTRLEIVNFEGQNFLTLSAYMGLFLMCFLPMLRGRLLVGVVLVAFIVDFLTEYFFASRLIFLLVPLLILMVFYIFGRSSRIGAFVTRFTMLLVFAFLLLLLLTPFLQGSDLPLLFDEAYDGLLDRIYEEDTVLGTVQANERWYELRAITSRMTAGDWLLGEGLVARWSDYSFLSGVQRDMVHNTWLNAFYWGGILLFFMITIPMVWVVRVFLKSNAVIALCLSAYMVLIYVRFPFFLTTATTQEWILFCLALGVLVRYEKGGA